MQKDTFLEGRGRHFWLLGVGALVLSASLSELNWVKMAGKSLKSGGAEVLKSG